MTESKINFDIAPVPDPEIKTIMYGGEVVHLKTVNDGGVERVMFTDAEGNP